MSRRCRRTVGSVAAAYWVFVVWLAQVSIGAPAILQPPPPTLISIPTGKAVVYLFNGTGPVLFGTSRTFKIDGQDVVKLSRHQYTEVVVEPGAHRCDVAGEKLSLELESGRYYFVLYAFDPGKSWAFPFAGNPTFFGEIKDDLARDMLTQYTHRPAREIIGSS